MKELKFRAWDRVKRKMLYGVSPFNAHITGENEPLLSLEYSKHDDCEFEQYTGLKDKNGKEIYEGDIVLDDDSGDIGEVEYYAPNFTFHPIYPIERWNSHYIGMYIKVIGNIHEGEGLRQ